jgi:hypothetical protein
LDFDLSLRGLGDLAQVIRAPQSRSTIRKTGQRFSEKTVRKGDIQRSRLAGAGLDR